MVGLLDELATMWKEAKVACFKVLPGNREELRDTRKNFSGVSLSWPNLKPAPAKCMPQALPHERLEEDLGR
jgi:hypothetical protein